MNRVLIRSVEHAEPVVFLLVLIRRAGRARVLVIVAKVWDALFFVGRPGAINALVLLIADDTAEHAVGDLLLKVLQVDLLASELDCVVRLALVDVSKLADVDLDVLVRAHLCHPISEVVEVILGSEAHVPLLVDSHDLVQIAGLMAFAA